MNLSAAFEGASQGLDQLASLQAQKEMQQAVAMRAENLVQLRNYLTTHRELIVTGQRTQALEDRDTKDRKSVVYGKSVYIGCRRLI